MSLLEELSADDVDRAREERSLLRQAVASIAVAVAIMVAMFVPQTSVAMETINWLALVPATIIQVWAGRRFYRAAWRAARHGTANMDTLVAIGTTRRLVVQRRRDAPSRRHPRGRAAPGDLLRLVDDHHRSRPARSLAGAPGQDRARPGRSAGSSDCRPRPPGA